MTNQPPPMPDPIKPTQADKDAGFALLGASWTKKPIDDVFAEAFALHAQQAREQALEEAAKGVADIAESIRKQASKNHPDSDRKRELLRQADELEMVAEAIRALKEPRHEA